VVIFGSMCVPFFAIYPFIKRMLDAWPLYEALIRVACIVVILSFASCFAISWAAQSSFRGYLLRSLDTSSAPGSSQSWPNAIPLKRALRLFGAHLWRYTLVVLPGNLALMWFLIGPGALTARDWATALKVQSINLSVGFVVGIWAMREALSVAYPGFRFQWVATAPRENPISVEMQPNSSVERKL
jgi:hypothetical protein